MRAFQAISKGFDANSGEHIAKGALCVIRLDSTGLIHLVNAGGHRFKEPGLSLNAYELHEYFTLGHSTQL